jgi:hypothetical protein
MPIYRLLQGSAFSPEVIELMTTAFENTCRELGLAKREDALRDVVARAIIACAEQGIRDPAELRNCARQALSK